MNDFSDSVMITLLPVNSDWCFIELPHCTLVYAGQIQDLTPIGKNELAKNTIDLALGNTPLTLFVTELTVFENDSESVEVLLLRPTPQLFHMRNQVSIWNKSEHKFNPHVTVGDPGSLLPKDIPDSITFDRVALGWGNELLEYRFATLD